MGYLDVESPEVLALSRAVREWEAPEPDPDGPAYKVDVYVGNDYDGGWEAAHPLVLELAAHDKNGVSAALAYMAEGSESDAPALIRWMMADAFKGLFDNEEAFARDQFEDALADHMEDWTNSQEAGFPFGVDWGEAIDWEYIGEQLTYGETWCFVAVDSGVYVFDVSILIDDYRDEE